MGCGSCTHLVYKCLGRFGSDHTHACLQSRDIGLKINLMFGKDF